MRPSLQQTTSVVKTRVRFLRTRTRTRTRASRTWTRTRTHRFFLLELGLGLGLVAKNSHSDSDSLKKQHLSSRKNNSNKRSLDDFTQKLRKEKHQALAARHLIASCRIVKFLDKHKADGLPLQQPDLSVRNSYLQNFVAIIKRNLS